MARGQRPAPHELPLADVGSTAIPRKTASRSATGSKKFVSKRTPKGFRSGDTAPLEISGGVTKFRPDRAQMKRARVEGQGDELEAPSTAEPGQATEFKKGGWIKGAIKHPGAFSAAAKRAGKSTHEYAEEKKHSSGTIGKRARLALTLGKLRK